MKPCQLVPAELSPAAPHWQAPAWSRGKDGRGESPRGQEREQSPWQKGRWRYTAAPGQCGCPSEPQQHQAQPHSATALGGQCQDSGEICIIYGLLALLQTQDQPCSGSEQLSLQDGPWGSFFTLLLPSHLVVPARSVPCQPGTHPWKKSDPCKASCLCPQSLQAHISCLTANRERCSPAGQPLGAEW